MGKGKSVLTRLQCKKICFHGFIGWSKKRDRQRLAGMAEVQGGSIVEDLDGKVNYLVLPDLSAGKTIQNKCQSLNSKGAAIQVIDADAFEKLVAPTEADALAIIRAGDNEMLRKAFAGLTHSYFRGTATPVMTFASERFDALDLTSFLLFYAAFHHCSFVAATLSGAHFGPAIDCDFSKARANQAEFAEVTGSRFIGANLAHAAFRGNLSNADFNSAVLDGATLEGFRQGSSQAAGSVFVKASMREAQFREAILAAPDFGGANLQKASFAGCSISTGNFRNADLHGATLFECSLTGADFTGGDCRGTNFGGANLTNARFDGADLADCNWRGANISGADFSKAKNYRADTQSGPAAGPAMTELDGVFQSARRVDVSFLVRSGPNEDGEQVSINSTRLKYGWGANAPVALTRITAPRTGMHFSDAMIQLANALANRQVRFETVETSSTKSSKGGKELRELALKAISEAFGQPVPPSEELAAATKAFREKDKDKHAAARKKLADAKAAAKVSKATEARKIEKQIAKQVGKVTDIATFLKALELRADKQKIDKATKMLKAERFQLFNDVMDTHINGVVKSQTDPDLVYACRIESNGQYACCTQNLNICGGLRGSICKHLLVLIIGLVKAEKLDPSTIDAWVAASRDVKAELNKDKMGEIFIRYKGAEAGEVDWRPTETVPEDYYAL